MKSLKPLLLVLAGVVITVGLLSFKNEEPKKEYLILNLNAGFWEITKPDLTVTKIKKENVTIDQAKIINDLSKEGWSLVEIYPSNLMGGGAVYLYFERSK